MRSNIPHACTLLLGIDGTCRRHPAPASSDGQRSRRATVAHPRPLRTAPAEHPPGPAVPAGAACAPLVPQLPRHMGARDVCAQPEFAEKQPTYHFMGGGGTTPSLRAVPGLRVAFSPVNIPSAPLQPPCGGPPGQPAALAAQRLPGAWGPAHTTLGRLWTSSGRGWRARGRGGAGPALMRSRAAAALAVGGRRLPPPPPPRPARAQSELDLVPCSGYCALSARAASLKQLASKNTLGLGSGRHGRRVCFYTPAPHLGDSRG